MESIRSALPVGRFISSMLEDGENCIHGQHWEWESAFYPVASRTGGLSPARQP